MHQSSASAVRLLAAWQQRRRELSDRLESLLLHGPTAVDRVAARADELREALATERDAFEAFVTGVQQPDRGAAPPVVDDGPVGELDPRGAVQPAVAYPPLRSVSDVGV